MPAIGGDENAALAAVRAEAVVPEALVAWQVPPDGSLARVSSSSDSKTKT